MIPEFTVLRKPRWRRDGETVAFWDDRYDRWQGLAGWTGDLLDAIDQGKSFADLLGIAQGRKISRNPDRKLRTFLFTLAELGFVELPRDPPPAIYDGARGRYERVRELGRGGVGVADLCTDLATGERVVVKRAWDFLQPYATTEAAVRREAEVLGRLDHPGVVGLLDAFELDGHMHVVRAFADGDDLTVYRHAGAPADAQLPLARDLASLLHHLHERGFLLVDLRPANFLLNQGRPLLIDVGQCVEHDGGERPFPAVVGSPGFMSPEMRDRRVASVRSDLFGLSRLLLLLASGVLARQRLSFEELMEKAGEGPLRDFIEELGREDPALRPAGLADLPGLLA